MMEKYKNNFKPIILITIAIIFVGAVGSGIYFYWQYQKVVKNPGIITKQETDLVLKKVNKLIDLPQDETPTVATVTDKDKIKDQDFFKKAENGDKVIIYTKAAKAFLYRPSIDKIIEVGPVDTGDTQKAAATGAITTNLRVVILNGTTTVGLTNSAEVKIKDKIPNVEILTKANAKKTDYTKTIVVDLSGNMPDQAKAVADAVGGTVSTLPAGETKPDADILVIAGQ